MKAIFIMDLPANCTECPLEMDVADTEENAWKGNICRGCGKRNADMHQKPDWCPLVSMPAHDMAGCGGEYDAGAKAGWNACLDVIERSDDDGE